MKKDLKDFIGERVTIFCCRYIYTGKLESVTEQSATLSDCGIVFETGSFSNKGWMDYQSLPHNFSIALSSIESFGLLK